MTAFALLLLMAAPVDGAEPSDARPNILFVFADDLGYGDLSCFGQSRVETPACDRLAAEGTVFEQFTVASGVCSPSRVATMTGHFPSRYRVFQHFAKPEQNAARGMPDYLTLDAPMLPAILRKAGYATGHFGKWHLSSYHPSVPDPAEYGFDQTNVFNGNGPSVFDGLEGTEFWPKRATTERAKAVLLSPAATEHADRFIRKHAEKPWFVNLWLHETHQLTVATEEEKAKYADVPEPKRTYLANVDRADRCVAKMLATLDELNLAERTIVVFSSDNGPENSNPNPKHKLYTSVGEAGNRRGRKRSLYLGGVNVPFIVRWPGEVPAGRRDEETVISAVDLMPTFLAAANVEPPEGYESDGENVLAVWRGQPFERSRPLFWHWSAARPTSPADWPELGMRDGRYAMVAAPSRDRVELYDVLADPSQANDLSETETDRAKAMLDAAIAFRETLPEAPAVNVNGPIPAKAPQGDAKQRARDKRKAERREAARKERRAAE